MTTATKQATVEERAKKQEGKIVDIVDVISGRYESKAMYAGRFNSQYIFISGIQENLDGSHLLIGRISCEEGVMYDDKKTFTLCGWWDPQERLNLNTVGERYLQEMLNLWRNRKH